MLRITYMATGVGTAKVEGAIAGEHVHELSRFAAAALQRATHLALDVSDVTFVDHAGAALLRALRAQGIEFVAGSSFISSLVDGSSTGTGNGRPAGLGEGGAE